MQSTTTQGARLRKQFTRGAAIDTSPAQHSLRKLPRDARRKRTEMGAAEHGHIQWYATVIALLESMTALESRLLVTLIRLESSRERWWLESDRVILFTEWLGSTRVTINESRLEQSHFYKILKRLSDKQNWFVLKKWAFCFSDACFSIGAKFQLWLCPLLLLVVYCYAWSLLNILRELRHSYLLELIGVGNGVRGPWHHWIFKLDIFLFIFSVKKFF